jgi:DNA-binding response OmpR family regulator
LTVSKPLEGKRILLVDDDQDIRTAMDNTLSRMGAEITKATDGNQAVEQAAEVDPDLIVLDVMLPGRSGFLVLEKVKKVRKPGTRPYVVMITANPGKRHQAYAETMGVDDYISKPFRMERLTSTIEKLLT